MNEKLQAVLNELGFSDVNARDKYGNTLLMHSARLGKSEAVKVLTDAGADVNAKNEDDITALMLAAAHGDVESVKVLADAGADVNARDGGYGTALMYAASHGNVESVKVLADAGADVNAKDGNGGYTALMHAVIMGRIEVIKALINAGADINATNADGQTALMFAESVGHSEAIEILKQAKKKNKLAHNKEKHHSVSKSLSSIRKKLARNIDEKLGTNLEQIKLPDKLKNVESQVSEIIFSKNR